MLKKIPIPFSFSLVKKGRVYLLLDNDYKDYLLEEGIEDLKSFLKRYQQTTNYLNGRTPHPSVLIKDGKRMVIRQYSHGGVFRNLTGNLYLCGSRSFRELTLTEEIRSSGIPTIKPIGAIHRIVFPPFYQAHLLSLEIPNAMNLVQYLQKISSLLSRENLLLKRKLIRSAGLLLRQFHQAGFFHRDLQLKNILIAEDQPLLIDFDRSFKKPSLSVRERIKNLLRLNRSVEKWRRRGLSITRTDRLRFFLAYAGEDLEIRKTLRRILRTYSLRSLFYQ